ncbi:MAG: DNA recombination/repair protein RecA, partial [Thermanaerothrix sp.]
MPRKPVPPAQPLPSHSDSNPGMDEAKRAVLDKALSEIIKRYGDGAIMRMGEAQHLTVEVIP